MKLIFCSAGLAVGVLVSCCTLFLATARNPFPQIILSPEADDTEVAITFHDELAGLHLELFGIRVERFLVDLLSIIDIRV